MTTNQIAYYKAREEERHNRAMEMETQRANLAKESIDRASQKANEEHFKRSDSETLRSHLAGERLQGTSLTNDYNRLQETKRSNIAQEDIARNRNAISLLEARSSAYLNYSTAGLRQAETALKDLEASYTIAKTNLTEQQTKHEAAQYYDTLAHVGLNQAQRDYVVTQKEFLPLNSWSSAIGNLGKGAAGITRLGG